MSDTKTIPKTFSIKELRQQQGLSQVKFAKKYDIPLTTLQHWEQGISTPPVYFIKLLCQQMNNKQISISDINGIIKYHYYPDTKTVTNNNGISLPIDIKDYNELIPSNVCLCLDVLFESYEKSAKYFSNSCEADLKLKKEGNSIVWSAFK